MIIFRMLDVLTFYACLSHVSKLNCKMVSIRDRPIWLFWGRYRYISHSWADILADTDISKLF